MRTFAIGLLALTACGDDGVHHLADAPPQQRDASVDAPPVPEPVTLALVSAGAPVAGATVWFQADDATEIATTTTDASGVASALMPHGGYVTTVDPFPLPADVIADGYHRVNTFTGVKPGDHLVLTDPNPVTAPAPPTFTITLPVDATAAYYDIYTDCGANVNSIYDPPVTAKRAPAAAAVAGPSATFSLYGCTATTATFVVVTEDASTFAASHFFVAPNVAIDQPTVDLTASTYAPVDAATFHLKNLPDLFGGANVDVDYLGTAGLFATSWSDTRGYGTATGGAADVTLPVLPAATGLRVERAELASNFGLHQLVRWGAAADADGGSTWDLAGLPLVDFSTNPTFDPATNMATWTAGTTGATPDAYYARFRVDRYVQDGSGNVTTNAYWDWSIVGPYTGAAIAPPALTGAAADYNVTSTDSVFVNDIVLGKLPGGYDLVRAHAFDLLGAGNFAALAQGAAGHFEIETAGGRKLARVAVHRSPLAVLHEIQRLTHFH